MLDCNPWRKIQARWGVVRVAARSRKWKRKTGAQSGACTYIGKHSGRRVRQDAQKSKEPAAPFPKLRDFKKKGLVVKDKPPTR